MGPNRIGDENRMCCTYTPMEPLPSEDQEEEYWIVQNSWWTEWGQHGFIYLKVEDGVGVSGMNQIIAHVDV